MLFPESFKSVSVTLPDDPDTTFFALRHSATSQVTPRKVFLLLHGYPQNHTLFYAFIKCLGNLGVLDKWDIVIPDLPGLVSAA
jgi:haloacetate dehalogenase